MKNKRRSRALAALAAIAITALMSSITSVANADQAPQTQVLTLNPSYANDAGQNIAYDPTSGTVYVSTFSILGPNADTGTIYSSTLGSSTLTPFLPAGQDGRVQAKGLAVHDGLLYVAGAQTGLIWVYNLHTRALVAEFDTGSGGLLNQIVVTRSGNVFVTDSYRPYLWHFTTAQVYAGCMPWRTDTNCQPDKISLSPELPYTCCTQADSINLNGIVSNRAGDTLWTIQSASATGFLWRIHFPDPANLQDRTIQQVPVTGGPFPGGEDLMFDSGLLLLTQNGLAENQAGQNGPDIDVIKLSDDGTSGDLLSSYTDPTLLGPSGIVRVGDRYLVADTHFVCINDCTGVAVAAPPWTVSEVPVANVLPQWPDELSLGSRAIRWTA